MKLGGNEVLDVISTDHVLWIRGAVWLMTGYHINIFPGRIWSELKSYEYKRGLDSVGGLWAH